MTLILAIPASDGIILASDGQVTTGAVRQHGRKILKLNEHCVWGGSGEVALIQRVQEGIGTANQPLEQLRDHLANAIKQCVTGLLNLDFRTPFCQGNPEALLSLHPGDFVFAEHRSEARILHITSYGTPEWIDRPFATGTGAVFAYALLAKYQGVSLNVQQASLLAFKVVEEAIEVGAYGLGPPIEIWRLSPTGVERLDEARIAGLADAARQLREAEVRLLFGELPRENGDFGDPAARET